MLRINQIRLRIQDGEQLLPKFIASKLGIPSAYVKDYTIYKKSVDARKSPITKVYTVDLELEQELEERILKKAPKDVSAIEKYSYEVPAHGTRKMFHRPIVVGFGPAGMFASLLLAREGYHPIIIERGSKIEERVESVEHFWKEGVLDPQCNVQFGEGGAGTFSDGKLTTRVKDPRSHKVLEEFVAHGAKPTITHEAHPHIGTDKLRIIVKNIREEIISLGGTFHFNTTVEDLLIENNQVKGVITKKGTLKSEAVLLCIGHSARDTYHALHNQQIAMTPKPFAVGVRVEHKQKDINMCQYGDASLDSELGAAEYFLTHTAKNKRGVFTFCMCPGGVVVPSNSEENSIVTNGMSFEARDQENANSAVLVQVNPSDYEEGVLGGIAFQEKLERKAFELGQGGYKAPAQYIEDYLNNQPSTKLTDIQPTYALGVTLTNLHKLFPKDIDVALSEGLTNFARKIKGFEKGIMIGVESRSSSPLRIERNEKSLQSTSVKGLYPCGEGCGYAGGIVSAAIDGLRVAEVIISNFQEPKVKEKKK